MILLLGLIIVVGLCAVVWAVSLPSHGRGCDCGECAVWRGRGWK